jgi:hypothetical protein
MKLDINFEQCSAGWKVTANAEGVQNKEELESAKRLIEDAAEFSAGLPGWNLGKEAGETDPEQNKWRKAYFAKKAWARGGGR